MKFDSYHPIINLIYFVTAITCALSLKHPVFLGISFVCAFLYSIKLGGRKVLLFNFILMMFALFYGVFYASYEHFGMTELWKNAIGNPITLEAILYGMTKGVVGAAVCMWFFCVFQLITTDKIVYLLGRISPHLSLFFSILLRTIPRVNDRAKEIETAREGIGKGVNQGRMWEKILHFFRVLSILITWLMENFVESANSMKSRGYSLKERTAYSIYRFDYRDGCLLGGFFVGILLVITAVLTGETKVYFDPMIWISPVTVKSFIYYVGYVIFLLLPPGLQIFAERKFS